MKMNATKLTIALVALLLALTCVFAACGKKNNTDKPDDTTPVDNTPVVDTVAKEDLLKIAEDFKDAYLKAYIDLYSADVVKAIDAAKSEALLKINSATSKEEAEKASEEFFTFLKAQKTVIDSIAALIEKIGDVSLQDADAINELKDARDMLKNAVAGDNAAKKAALDAYKADAATQKTINALISRYNEIDNAKMVADTAKGEYYANGTTKALTDGINVKIAAMKADFAKADKEFKLADLNDYTALLTAIDNFAKTYNLVAATDAYKDVIDLATLDAAKATLDAAFAKDEILAKMLALVNASDALTKAADAALWREYVYMDLADLSETGAPANAVKLADGTVMYAAQPVVLKESAFTAPAVDATVTLPDGATKHYDMASYKVYATAEDAEDDDVENPVKVEAKLAEVDYKLTLKADVEAAVKVAGELFDYYVLADLAKYGYNGTDTIGTAGTDEASLAAANINTIATNYAASVGRALAAYNASFGQAVLNNKTNLAINGADAKDDTTATYSLKAEFDLANKKLGNTVSTNQTTIKNAIDAAKSKFTTKDLETDTYYSGASNYVPTGDYYAAAGYGYKLVDGVPTITYTAWTYTYELKDVNLAATTKLDVFDRLSTTDGTGDPHAVIAKKALRFLAMYIGDGEYADTYDFSAYKTYAAGFNNKVLYMTDRDITEVAVPGVVQIRGKDVDVAKDETVTGAKLLSAYNVAKALVAEEEKIVAAKADAVKEIKEAALALRAAGNANAVKNAKALLDDIQDGSYLNEKLYGDDSADGYLKQNLAASGANAMDVKVIIQVKPNEETENVVDFIGKAVTALTKARDSLDALEANRKYELVKSGIVNAPIAAHIYVDGYVDDNNTNFGDGYAYVAATYVTLKDLEAIYFNGYKVVDTDNNAEVDVDSITTLNTKLADNAKFVALYKEYIEKAQKALDIATAGENAKVIGAEVTTPAPTGHDDKGNLVKAQAETNLARVQSIQNIFSNYSNFEGIYVTDAAYLGALGSITIGTYLNAYAPAAAVASGDHAALVARLQAIVNAWTAGVGTVPGTSSEDTLHLNKTLKAATDKFADKLDAYKNVAGLLASDALDQDTAVEAANTAITAFIENEYADYINLKATYAFGDDTVDFDFLTEVYRERTMKKAQNVIKNVLTYANTCEAGDTPVLPANTIKDALIGTDATSWVATTTKKVNGQTLNFAEVTSVKTAEANLKSYSVSESIYALQAALDIFNNALTNDITLKQLKEAAFN